MAARRPAAERKWHVTGDRRRMEAAVRAFHERTPTAARELVETLVDEHAEMILFGAGLRPVVGRAGLIERLTEDRMAVVFSATIEHLEWLDERTVLASGRARYPVETGGLADRQVWWLNQFREGLLRRVEGFHDELEARQAYEESWKV